MITKEDANKLFNLFCAYGQYTEMKEFFRSIHDSTESIKYSELKENTNRQFQKLLAELHGSEYWFELPHKDDKEN